MKKPKYKVKNLTAEGIARRAAAHRAVLDDLVAEMHADYMRPMSLHRCGVKYHRTPSCVRELFERRGLYVRPFKQIARQANGSPVRYVPFTGAQLTALIAQQTRLRVPRELRFEWRSWTIERRGAFIARLRARLNTGRDRPASPFSSNVEPFDYTSSKARAIAAALNAGRESRHWAVRIRVTSQGVIWRGQLWFWASERIGGAYYTGPWRCGVGRPSLHHTIWEAHHRRTVPAGHVVRFADGNPNNHLPSNLVLATRNDLARENQAAHLQRVSREKTAILLNRSQTKGSRHGLADTLLASVR